MSDVGREIAEIVRGQRRQQAHADVGRRRAARQLRLVAVLPDSCRAAARHPPSVTNVSKYRQVLRAVRRSSEPLAIG